MPRRPNFLVILIDDLRFDEFAALATAGAGDVLTGVIAALVGQKLSPWAAARLGVHLHGLAGDLAAAELGQASLIATDLLRFLPRAFQQHAEGEREA